MAAELQRVFRLGGGDQNVNVQYIQQQGALRITCSLPTVFQLRIYRLQDLQNAAWLQNEWFSESSWPQGETVIPGNLRAASGLFPAPNVAAGHLRHLQH